MKRGGQADRLRSVGLLAAYLTAVASAVAVKAYAADRLEHAAKAVFGPRAAVALCIAHYESTDGAHLYNGSNLGPWQVNVTAHPWVDRRRVVVDWLYSARVAYRISSGGRDWSDWTTHRLCGV